MEINNRKFLKIGEASRYLGVHPNTLRNWERKGIITPLRLNTLKVYPVDVLDKMLTSGDEWSQLINNDDKFPTSTP